MEQKPELNKKLYQCSVCGLHYRGKETAEQCEAWCNKHQSCNLDIIEKAVEHTNSENNERGTLQ